MADEGFTGMAALISALQALPAELRQEAGVLVDDTADMMADHVRQRYQPGTLREGVKVDKGDLAGGALRARVRSTARHAHLYERGTVQRFTSGTGANRGTMPAAKIFIPAAIKARSDMVRQLIGVVRSAHVSGMTGTLDVVERGGD